MVGLDARLRDLQIEVVDPAVVSQMRLQCTYPSYLQNELSARPSEETIEYRAGVRIPEGTKITLVGTSSSRLARVEYVMRGPSDETPASDADSLAPAGPDIQSVAPAGTEFRIALDAIRKSQVIELRLIDEFGLSSDQILRYVITTLEDTPPEVESKLVGIGTAVTPKAILPIRGSVLDDYALANVKCELVFNEQEPLSIALQVDGEDKSNRTSTSRNLPQADWESRRG
ncbi:MAG: hypothetical protein R3C53_10300 [Pirellulaceae bacterium]